MTDIKVSVACITYNHEKYIRRALEGFVAQKTDFPFEVIVFDDASTDGTADIIREYENKYPQIIKPIYQQQNVYSRGISATKEYVLPIMRGEYIAICEGDDYWTDENKLQIQYDYMKEHPECAFCMHQATIHDCQKSTDKNLSKFDEDRIFSADDVIAMSGGAFATNSFFMKKIVYTNIPDCLVLKGCGDYTLLVNGGLNGTIYYTARNMSTYNYAVSGSWSVRVARDRQNFIDHCERFIVMLNKFNKEYDYKYDSAVQKRIAECEYKILSNQGKYFKLKKQPYREFYLEDVKEKGKLKVFLKCVIYRFGFIYKLYSALTGRNK